MPAVHDLTGPAGRLEALLDAPAGAPRAAVVFAHPLPTHGGTMHTKAVYQATKGLVRTGCAVLRFNFRGVGASDGSFTGGDGEKEDFTAALDYMTARYPVAAAVGRRLLVRRLDRARDRRRRRARHGADRHRAAGDQEATTSRTRRRSHQAEVLHPGRGGRHLPAPGHVEVLQRAARAEGAGRSSTPRITCSTAHDRGRRGASRICVERTWHMA